MSKSKTIYKIGAAFVLKNCWILFRNREHQKNRTMTTTKCMRSNSIFSLSEFRPKYSVKVDVNFFFHFFWNEKKFNISILSWVERDGVLFVVEIVFFSLWQNETTSPKRNCIDFHIITVAFICLAAFELLEFSVFPFIYQTLCLRVFSSQPISLAHHFVTTNTYNCKRQHGSTSSHSENKRYRVCMLMFDLSVEPTRYCIREKRKREKFTRL